MGPFLLKEGSFTRVKKWNNSNEIWNSLHVVSGTDKVAKSTRKKQYRNRGYRLHARK